MIRSLKFYQLPIAPSRQASALGVKEHNRITAAPPAKMSPVLGPVLDELDVLFAPPHPTKSESNSVVVSDIIYRAIL